MRNGAAVSVPGRAQKERGPGFVGTSLKKSESTVECNTNIPVPVRRELVWIWTSGVARAGQDGRGPCRNKWSRSHCTGDRRAAWNGRYATAWSVRYEHEVEVHAATLEAGQVSDHHLCPRCLREDGEPTASPGLVLIRQSRKTLYLDGGRLLVAPTDWRILCRPISSTPAVRQLSAGKSGLAQCSSPGSSRGEEGGKLREHIRRATVAR